MLKTPLANRFSLFRNLALLGLLLSSQAAWSMSVSPSPSTNGSYTVSWSQPVGWYSYYGGIITQVVYLQEKVGGGVWTNVTSSQGTTHAFSGKPENTYQYRIYYYYYYMGSYSSEGISEGPVSVQVIYPPATPSIPTGPGTDADGSYTISWAAVSGATAYRLQERFNGGGWTEIYYGGGTGMAVSGRAAGSWDYIVQACSATGCGGWSGVLSVGVLPATPAPPSGPGTDANGSYTISWGTVSGATNYHLQERFNGGGWTELYYGGGTGTTVSGRAAGNWEYIAQACNAGGCGGWSGVLSVGVLPATAGTPTGPGTDFDGGYGIGWGGVSGASNYHVQERFNGGGWTELYYGGGTGTTVSGRAAGSWGYIVQACNAAGCGGWSGVKTVLVPVAPGTPTGPNPNPDADGSYGINWSLVSEATGYRLLERLNGGGWSEIYYGGGTGMTVSGRTAGFWDYIVQTCSSSGCGGWSGVLSVGVLPGAPGTPGGPNPNPDVDGSYGISWGSVSGATSYRLRERLNSGTWAEIYNNSGTSTTVSGRATGAWEYQAQACGAAGCGNWSATLAVGVLSSVPGTPGGPGTDYDGSYTITWVAVSGTTGYRLQERFNGGAWTEIYYGGGTSMAVSGRAAGGWEYIVQSCNAVGCSGWSGTKTVTVAAPTAPGTLSGPTPNPDVDGSYGISWSAVTEASNYKLRERLNGGAWAEIYNNTGTSTMVSGRATGAWDYQAQACSATGCGVWSGVLAVNVDIPLPPPSAPQWNSAPANSDFGDYTLSWQAATGTVSGYTFQERRNGSDWVEVPLTPNTALNYAALGKLQGEYEYRVRACNEDACGNWSDTHGIAVHNLQGIAPATSIVAAVAPGTLGYGASVTSQGEAAIRIPIEMYPGVNGLQPDLSIVYNSGRPRQQIDDALPEDILGYGWSLGGLSSIRRCVKNRSDVNAVQLNDTDSLCLDGEPLVLVAGNHLQQGAQYRTLRESYIRIEQIGTASEPWFQVTSPDGTVSKYGYDANARVRVEDAVQTSTYFEWSLDSRADRFGNTLNVTYHKDPLNGINYPLSIDYGGAQVQFFYATRTDAQPMPLDTIAQGQLVLLHTIKVKRGVTLVREYRLASEQAPEGWRRLAQAQICGYDAAGATPSCLAPLQFHWLAADPEIIPEGFKTGVDLIIDGLGAMTEFDFGIIDDTTETFLFSERPFGDEIPIPDTVDISDEKLVVIAQQRSDGLGDYQRTTYAYHGRGLMSTRNWGFLGFYAQRITDEASGIVTYRQFRQDYPYYGRVSAVIQYDAIFNQHTEQLSRQEFRYADQATGVGTDLPYVSESLRFIFEDNVQLGVEQTVNAYAFANGFIDGLTTTARTAATVSETAPGGSVWGEVPSYSLSDIQRSSQSALDFLNRTDNGEWLIGFTESVTTRAYRGEAIPANLDRTQSVTMSPYQTPNNDKTNAVYTATRFPGDTEYELVTTQGYDAHGNRTSTTVAGVNVASRNESALDFVDNRYPGKLRNALNHETEVTYDLRFGLPQQVTDPNGRVTRISYDAFGREVQRITPDDVAINTSYAFCDVLICALVNGILPAYRIQTSSALVPTRTSYRDQLGREVRTEVASFLGTEVIRQDTYYDAQGRVEQVTAPYFSGAAPAFTVLSYDLRQRVIETQRPDGSATAVDYAVDSVNNTVTVTVTEALRNAQGQSAGTRVKESHYNILGELVRTTDAVGTAQAIVTVWTYDGSGLPLTTVVDGGESTTYAYDQAGNRTHLTSPDFGTVESLYTALGQVRWQQDAKLQATTYQYDLLGRLTTRTDADGTADWSYDPANGFGYLGSRTDNAGFSETRTYNANAQLSAIQTVLTVGYSWTYNQDYLYDSNGRIDKITYPSGIQVQYGYNTQGYLETITDTGSNTVLQRFNATDAFGHVTAEEYGNGIATERAYNPQTGRLESLVTLMGSTALQDNDYAWRSDGVLESRTESVGAPRQETFSYDALDRLTAAQTWLNGNLSRTLATSYDRLGNIVSKTSDVTGDPAVTGYQYGTTPNAGPHAVSQATVGGINTTFHYDANGNVTYYQAASGDHKYLAWNARNLPEVILVGDSPTTTTPTAREDFYYGPDGERYYKKSTYQAAEGQRIEHTFYVGSFEEIIPTAGPDLTRVQKTQVTENVLHVKTTNALLQVTEAIEYLHRDHLGSVERITDENGYELQVLAYDPFGARRNSDWIGAISPAEFATLLEEMNIHTPRGFTGHEHLDRTGIIHMNGRIYDPQLERFLSPDPFVPQPTLAQSWNRYSYVLNNPLSYTDPSGYAEQPEEITITRERPASAQCSWYAVYCTTDAYGIAWGMEAMNKALNAYWDGYQRALWEGYAAGDGRGPGTPPAESGATKKAKERLSGEDNRERPDFDAMSPQEMVDWILEHADELGIKIGSNVEKFEAWSTDYWMTEGGRIMPCVTSDCGGMTPLSGYYDQIDTIRLFPPAFNAGLNAVIGNDNEFITRHYSTSPIESAVFTFAHESAHSMGIDLIPGNSYHTNADAAGISALNRFRDLYGP